LARELRQLNAWKEEFVKTENKESGRYNEIIERAEEQIRQGKEQLDDLRESLKGRTHDVVRKTDRFVHEHPWQATGTAVVATLLLGIAIGMMVSRSMTQEQR
jgi:ElaB/YqjD/DUF883 family membrane-anchored ribosome-binding protein